MKRPEDQLFALVRAAMAETIQAEANERDARKAKEMS